MSAIRFLPFVILLILAGVVYRYFDRSVGIIPFSCIYLVYTIISLPGLSVLDATAGILYGPWVGTLLVTSLATAGALLVFLTIRYALPNLQIKNVHIQKIAQNFQAHETGYLLGLRLIPVLPFGFVNIGLALSKVRLTKFLWTTFIGVLPIAFLTCFFCHYFIK